MLLIGDEVQSGFVKTGKMFALQNWGVTPDLMTMAKAISNGFVPFGGVAINDKVYQVLKDNPLWHGYTYSGHPVGAAASIPTLNAYIKEKVADNAAKVGKHMAERIEAEFKSLPCVGSFTAQGLMIGLEIVTDKKTKTPFPAAEKENLWRKMLAAGVLARPLAGYSGNRLFICPPCILTIEEADKMLDAILPVLAAVKSS